MTNINKIIELLKNLTFLEVINLIKEIENTFNITSNTNLLNKIQSNDLLLNSKINVQEEIKDEKIKYTITLQEILPANKITIIKIIRTLTGLGINECKNIVENTPKKIKEGLSKLEMEKFKTELETAGAKILIS